MKNKIILPILILAAAISVFSCKDDKPTESGDELFGSYKSSTFRTFGAADQPIDIQKLGGSFEVMLKYDYKFDGVIFIPEGCGCNFPEGTTDIFGDYVVNSDTVNIIFSPYYSFYFKWKKETEQLETFDVLSRGPQKIILDKQN